jgi:catechol 2,3-dioxygenase-like lactoylglutathione lyase family enzyme
VQVCQVRGYNRAVEALFTGLQAVVVRVRSMPEAQRFYGQTLGLPAKFELSGVSIYDTGNCEICDWALEPGETLAHDGLPTAYPNFATADAAATHAALSARGVSCEPLSESGPVLWFSFYDPDGNRLDCCQTGA